MHVAWLAAGQGRARVVTAIEIGGDAIGLAERGGDYLASLRYRLVAIDGRGTVVGSDARKLSFDVKATRRDQMTELGSRIVSSFDLKPGTYRIRGSVSDDGSGHPILSSAISCSDRRAAKAPVMSSILLTSKPQPYSNRKAERCHV
jgi:hypothetical protein